MQYKVAFLIVLLCLKQRYLLFHLCDNLFATKKQDTFQCPVFLWQKADYFYS